MKTALLLIAAILICGCQPKATQWEYWEFALEDQSHAAEKAARDYYLAKKTTIEEYERALNYTKSLAGQFDLHNIEIIKLDLDGWELTGTFLEPKADAKLILIFKRPFRSSK